MPIKDKVAIIAGGTHGIGQATARLFAQNGAKIIVADKDEYGGQELINELQNLGADATFINCDISERLDILNLMAATLEAYNKIDILINAAAMHDDTEFLDLSEEKFEAVLDVNLKGAFLLGKATSLQMIKQIEQGMEPGAIIYISSFINVLGGVDDIAFNVATGGLKQLTKSMAETLSSYNIRVNTISTMNVTGRVLDKMITNESKRKKALEDTPSGRFGDPEEIAEIAKFLVSPAASYITGQTLNADGGTSLFHNNEKQNHKSENEET